MRVKMKKFCIAMVSLFMGLTMICSCDADRSTAKKMANRYLSEQLIDTKMKEVSFSRLDSTSYITPDILQTIRQKTAESGLFKNEVIFDTTRHTRPLRHIGVDYKDSKDHKHHITFYFDSKLEEILAVKTN